MSTLAQIEAALSSLSPEELARIEAVLHRLRSERCFEARFDGKPWPATPEARDELLTELDSLPPLLDREDADRFDSWRAVERERQKLLSANVEPGHLFT